MVWFTYIPTGEILEMFGVGTPFASLAVAKGLILIEQSVKDKFSPDHLVIQYNPDIITYGRTVDYAERRAPGMDLPNLQYIGGTLREMPLRLIIEDDVDGPPLGFEDLSEVITWFDNLSKPIPAIRRPPRLDIIFGGFVFDNCVLVDFGITVLKAYNNLLPRIVEITGTFKESVVYEQAGMIVTP